jgi:hypothetical protein
VKTIDIDKEQRPLSQLLGEGDNDEVIYLTRQGQKKYALVPFDEMDEEVLAIRRNPELLAYLSECFRRAKTQPGTRLEDVRKELGLD